MGYIRVERVPKAQLTAHSLSLLALCGPEAATVAKAIKDMFEAANKRDWDGELPPSPTGLTEIGEAAYEACQEDILEGINHYWETCEARKPKPPPETQGDISRLKSDISQTYADYTNSDLESELETQTNRDSGSNHEISNTRIQRSEEIEKALRMIRDAGIEVDDGLIGFLVNNWRNHDWSMGCIKRAVESCRTKGRKTARQFTGTLRTINEQDFWRDDEDDN